MNHKTHRLGGLCAGLIVSSSISPEFAPPIVATVILSSFFGSYVPDIDEPNSVIGKKFPMLSKSAKAIFKHRGFIHTPICCILLSFGVYMLFKWLLSFLWFDIKFASYVLVGFIVGYISHLLLDTITPKGVMWFYPFYQKYISTQSQWFVNLIMILSTFLYFTSKYNLHERLYDWILFIM